MNNINLLLTLLLAFCAVKVHSLECYNCEGNDCTNIQDSMSEYCGPASTTATTPTTTTTSSLPTETAPQTTDTTEDTDITDTTETSSDSTTDMTITTEDPTEATTITPEVSAKIVQVFPNNFVRTRRSLSQDYVSPTDVLLSNYRLKSRNSRADSTYSCYSIDIPDGDATKRKHGCIEIPAELAACEAVRQENNIPTSMTGNCETCSTDKCNGSTALGISMMTLLAALIVHQFST